MERSIKEHHGKWLEQSKTASNVNVCCNWKATHHAKKSTIINISKEALENKADLEHFIVQNSKYNARELFGRSVIDFYRVIRRIEKDLQAKNK